MGTVTSEQRNGPGKLETLGIRLVIFQYELTPGYPRHVTLAV